MKTLFEILFFKNYSFYVWNLVIGLFVAEVYILKKKIIPIDKAKWVIFGVSVFVGIGLVLRSSPINNEEIYSTSLVPHESACLVVNYDESYDDSLDDIYQNTPRYLHYFEGKTLTIASCVDNKDDIIAYFSVNCPKLIINLSNEFEEKIPDRVFENIIENTLHLKKDGRLFILDSTWEKSDSIVCIQSGGQVFFASEQLILDVYADSYEADYLCTKDRSLDELVYMNKRRGERDVNQIVFLFVLYLLGWSLSTIVFYGGGGEKAILSAFFGLPLGLSIINSIGVIYVLMGIPLRKIVVLSTLGILIILMVWTWKKTHVVISKKDIMFSMVIPFIVISFMIYMKMYIMVGDSLEKTLSAIRMAEYPTTRENILGHAEIGLLELIVHSLGWKFHIDFVYGIYSLIPICILGILISSIKYISNNNRISAMIALIGMIFLLSNDDFMTIGFFVHINAMMACFILMLVIMLVSFQDYNIYVGLIISSLALGVITSRLEGPMYICLIFALLMGLEKFRDRYVCFNFIVAAEIIIWEMILIIGVRSGRIIKGIAWDVEDALVVVIGAIAIIILPFILRIRNRFILFVIKNYYKIAIVAFALASVVMLFYGPGLSLKTAKILAKHFATSYTSNSGGIWSFSLLMLPLVLKSTKKTSRFLVALVVCYIFSLYILFSLRTGNPIHWDHNDSCRRTLFQIMPTTMFAIAYIMGGHDECQTDLKN